MKTIQASRMLMAKELYDSLIYGIEGNRPDVYYVLADFDSYVKAQEKVGVLYTDKDKWNKMSAINIAASGVFSSDNTIQRYAEEIWNV